MLRSKLHTNQNYRRFLGFRIGAAGQCALLLAIGALAADVSAAVLVEAHRGDSFNAPENTVASIQAAASSADLTEMDVRVTADGALVIEWGTAVRDALPESHLVITIEGHEDERTITFEPAGAWCDRNLESFV